ncbi:hypothetical protein WMY93_031658 [Mugilogobius chulae]|uniref:Protein-tyrosine-phosphatase n=1 Tax=Mugilogobius chulae TaxID=88201 RepID=A0AAW0MLM2_9GOBI
MSLSQILPSLFLSGSNVSLSSQKNITLIVNVTLTHPSPLPAPRSDVQVLRVPVRDLPSAPLSRHFDAVAERIHGNVGGTLVHCALGRSRSPALVMAYLMRFRGASLRQAHELVRDKRPDIRLNRGFWEQLLSYERKLYGHNSVRLEEEEEGGARGHFRPGSSLLTRLLLLQAWLLPPPQVCRLLPLQAWLLPFALAQICFSHFTTAQEGGACCKMGGACSEEGGACSEEGGACCEEGGASGASVSVAKTTLCCCEFVRSSISFETNVTQATPTCRHRPRPHADTDHAHLQTQATPQFAWSQWPFPTLGLKHLPRSDRRRKCRT